MSGDGQRCRLYLVTPPRFEIEAFAGQLAAALDGGDVAAVQLRLKDAAEVDICLLCDRLRPIVQDRGVAFILNDRPDLAARLGCDGVHIGQDDGLFRAARDAVGADAIVGVTCHDSRHLAIEAAEAGADYVAFGAFFATATKTPKARAGLAILEWWSALMTVPCAAIGGITVDNAPPLIAAGADFLAVCAGVWDHPRGPAAAVAEFERLFAGSGG